MRNQSMAFLAMVGFGVSVAIGLLPDRAEAKLTSRPCETGFDLKMSVQAVDGVNAEGAGLSVKYDYTHQKGQAIDTQSTSRRAEFNAESCKRWQKNYWDRLDRLLFDNKRPERKKLACNNIGLVEYKVGAKHEKVKVCLADANGDSVTRAFRSLYDGSDALIGR